MGKGKHEESNYVTGYARPLDYIIHINLPLNTENDPNYDIKEFFFKNKRYFSTFNHELVHYYQFMATAVGRRICQLNQFICAWQTNLLKELP